MLGTVMVALLYAGSDYEKNMSPDFACGKAYKCLRLNAQQ